MDETQQRDNQTLHAQIGNVTACILTGWGQVLSHITIAPYSRPKLGLQALICVFVALALYAYVWRRLSSVERIVVVFMLCANLWTIVLALGAML